MGTGATAEQNEQKEEGRRAEKKEAQKKNERHITAAKPAQVNQSPATILTATQHSSVPKQSNCKTPENHIKDTDVPANSQEINTIHYRLTR